MRRVSWSLGGASVFLACMSFQGNLTYKLHGSLACCPCHSAARQLDTLLKKLCGRKIGTDPPLNPLAPSQGRPPAGHPPQGAVRAPGALLQGVPSAGAPAPI